MQKWLRISQACLISLHCLCMTVATSLPVLQRLDICSGNCHEDFAFITLRVLKTNISRTCKDTYFAGYHQQTCLIGDCVS